MEIPLRMIRRGIFLEGSCMTDYKIREIQAKDNQKVENLIRTCLLEFGGNREGTAWCDPDLGRFSEIYNKSGYRYWVAEDEEGNIVGGAGIGMLTEDVCELQKMYCLKEARGTGLSHELMNRCLTYARHYYEKCYLETFSNMIAANKFYQKYGFVKLSKPYLETEHFSCDIWYLKELDEIEFEAKRFDELTTTELYEILKARANIFFIEQGIQYVDMDDVDYDALHCFLKKGNTVISYLRAYYKGEDKAVVKIGRVLSSEHGKGYGRRLMEESLPAICERMGCTSLCMDSQKHAIEFYEKFGFQVVAGEFLEAGITHVEMRLEM